jgi:hypothetical protein
MKPVPHPPELGWHHLAKRCARIAHKHDSASHCGVYYLYGSDDAELIAYYDNRHYKDGPHIRNAQFCRIRRRLDELGIRVLAEAIWPTHGEAAGYSAAMIFDVSGQEEEDLITQVIREEIDKTNEMLLATVIRN